MHYSLFSLVKQGLLGNKHWPPVWRDTSPKPAYDVIIIGGGGHGLATAYYLAKYFAQAQPHHPTYPPSHPRHPTTHRPNKNPAKPPRRIAVLEKSWLGSGNVGRNTTIIRSNYLLAANTRFYEFSLQLWQGLEAELNFNAMVSQRGVLNLFHSDAQRDAVTRRGNAMLLHGADAKLLTVKQLRRMYPLLDYANPRFPIKGGLWQPRGGNVRHDAVAWGYGRGAARLGVDLIQNCEVVGFLQEDNRCVGVATTQGKIRASKIGVAVAGATSKLMAKAGLRLPLESHVLQAFVSESLKPILPGVITFGGGHFYISQSNKGGLVFGGDVDGYNSYAARGNLPVVTDVAACGVSLMPAIAGARILRGWGGVVDMSMDGAPIIDSTPVAGLYLNAGWCYGGFKATPASGWCFAHLLATDTPHPLANQFRLDRFRHARLLDEKGAGAQPNHH